MKNKKYQYLFLLIFCISCSTTTAYINPNSDKGSSQWGPREIIQTSNKMVNSLYDYLKKNSAPAFLDFEKLRNKTSEHIDTSMLANEISTELIRRKIKFIDRTQTEATIKEIEIGQTGLVDQDSAIPAGELKSPNYTLNGEISENLRYVDGSRVQYLIVTLKLINVATTEVVWQEKQEFLKSTKENKYSW